MITSNRACKTMATELCSGPVRGTGREGGKQSREVLPPQVPGVGYRWSFPAGVHRGVSLCTVQERLVEEMEVSEAEGADLFWLYAAVCSFKRTVKTLQLSYMPASRMILKQHLLNLGFQVLGMACPDHSCPLWILFIWPPAHKAGQRKTLL